NGVEVDGGRAATHRAVQVHQRRGVGAHAVDQHQGLVGALAAQGGRTDGVGAVGVRRAREVDGGHGDGQGGGQFGGALLLQRLGVDHIDRRQRFKARARLGAAASDDQLLHLGRGRRGGGGRGGLGLGHGPGGDQRDGRGRGKQNYA